MNRPSLKDLVLYFMKLGATGFGGPIALTSRMQTDLVDGNGWFSQETFQEGMTLSQLAPGPLAAQLAIYFGWAHSGVWGATLVGLGFIIPSFLMVVVFAAIYLQVGAMPVIQRLFHGIGPAVIALVAIGAYKLSKKNLKRDWALWTIALVTAAFTVITESESIAMFLVGGLLIAFLRSKFKSTGKLLAISPAFLVNGLNGPASEHTFLTILLFFLKSGTFVFGSGLAIVPFLHGGVVVENHWLTEAQFLDAVAVAMITPGPVVITVGFIGYLVGGLLGAVVAALGTFVPCYLFTVIPAPHFSKIVKIEFLRNFVIGVTAAAVGAILGAAVVLGGKSLVDVPTCAIFAIVLGGLLFIKKIPEPVWILLAGAAGFLIL